MARRRRYPALDENGVEYSQQVEIESGELPQDVLLCKIGV